jgi:Phage tail assembly chaperone proteins, E, or 41 or 14
MATNGVDATGIASDLPTDVELAEAQKAMEDVRADFPYEVHLSEPVKAHGDTVDSLTIQLPRAGDVVHSGGDPWADGPGKPADLRRLIALVSRLAGVPESTVKQLAMQDLKAIEFILTPLFTPSLGNLRRMFSTLRDSSGTSAR